MLIGYSSSWKTRITAGRVRAPEIFIDGIDWRARADKDEIC